MVTIIGSDECLKGDTFGGIVVCAVWADESVRMQLAALGVKDSKLMSDTKIKAMAEKIRQLTKVSVVNMYPKEYNTEVLKYGIVEVMNKLHAKCINSLKGGIEMAVVDQYPGCRVDGAECYTHAESKYVEVAAASVVARAEGLKQMRELSVWAGFKLPLGSTHVLDALIKIREANKDFTEFKNHSNSLKNELSIY